MIAKKYRFKGNYTVAKVFNGAKKINAGPFAVFVKPARYKTARVAVVASKKVHKSAVVRNRIRRRLYELVRKEGFVLFPLDMVFVVYDQRVASMPHEELAQKLDNVRLELAKK